MPADLLLVSILRTLVEVAGSALLGQGLLALIAGKRRHDNLFYSLLRVVAAPAVRGVRFLAPRVIADAHVPMLTFFLLFWLWLALGLAKRHLCVQHGLAC